MSRKRLSKHRDLQLKWLHRETNDNTLIVIVATTMNNNNLFLDIVCENAYFLIRFRLSSTLKRRWKRRLSKTVSKVETFENASFWKRSLSRYGRVKTETFENDDVKSVTWYGFQIGASIQDGGWLTYAQFQVPVVFIVLERFSVNRWKRYKNASVDENILLRFLRDENINRNIRQIAPPLCTSIIKQTDWVRSRVSPSPEIHNICQPTTLLSLSRQSGWSN